MNKHLFSNSINEKNFLSLLSNTAISTISFDIFDTLFFRKCGSPETIFEIMGEKEKIKNLFDTSSAFSLYRQNGEKNAKKFHQPKEDVTLNEIYEQLPVSDSCKEYFKQVEFETEKEMLTVNIQIERWIDLAYAAGKTIILISDMYYTADEIEILALCKLNNRHKISKVYMSSDYRQTKMSGNLFFSVLGDLNITASALLHIGDNLRSDVEVPKNIGINTMYYGLTYNEKEALRYENIYLNENVIQTGHFIRHLALLQNSYEDSLEKFYFRIGASIFGPILWEFSHWLHTIATKFKMDQLSFIMREGAILEKCFKMLYPEFQTNLFYASRKSTNFLTINTKDLGSVNFNTFRNLTVNDLYDNFFLTIENSDIKKYSNTLCQEINQITLNDTKLITIILNDIKTREAIINEKLSEQKKLLRLYLEHMNINQSSAFVDFGGGGTVLQRLHNILPKKNKPNIDILFYQHSEGYKKLSSQHIVSFLPYSKKNINAVDSLARTPEFIEILLNGMHPTTVHYSLQNNKVKPNTYLPECNKKELPNIINSFWSGIETFIELSTLYNMQPNIYLSTTLSLLLSRVIELPTKEEVDFLGSLEYDEGKGTQNFYKIVNNETYTDIHKTGIEHFYKSFLSNPMKTKHTYPWVQGIITKISKDYLMSLYKIKDNPNQKIINILLDKIDTLKKKKIMIYGAGELFVQLLPYLRERNIEISALIDSRADIKPFVVEDYEVVSLEDALKDQKDVTILIASGVFSEAIKQRIRSFASNTLNSLVIIDGIK